MNVVIAGGTGFVGKHITRSLINRGDHVFILTRYPKKYQNSSQVTYVGWMGANQEPESELSNIDAIINLAGETLYGYWTKGKKDKIFQSRINTTYAIIELIRKMEHKPRVLINASAVGYFGTSKSKTFTESSPDKGDDFLAEVTQAWEKTAFQAKAEGVRTVIARLGVVLGEEGALPFMTLPFKFYAGGKIGSGEQWVSWVHIEDVVSLVLYALDNPIIKDVYHITAPNPVQNDELSEEIAQSLNRPNWLTTPAFLLKRVLGEMSILVADGQKVLPQKAIDLGYPFQYPTIDKALRHIFT
ncbi:TIGR01777 family oxidoreductase [Gracilibacillus sp. YIM 98692]|uniref:TIGR01777 family oxidoreductase n=1 Tax=Gracilibacillus sp. YIM 98692 TaxID=2663532 RepID=UPI0013D0524E|nr:TIGR01777 family oxidoreductase [Gracilibacillus sp. YIM 98692]